MNNLSLRAIKIFILVFFFFIFSVSVLSVFSTRAVEADDRYVAQEENESEKNLLESALQDLVKIDLSNSNYSDVEACETIAKTTLSDFSKYLESFKTLTIHDDTSKRRGLSNGEKIYLRCLDDKDEYLNVMIHELGHTVDLLYLKHNTDSIESNFMDFSDPVYISDPSLNFYNLSWVNSDNVKSGIVRNDFVSTYAMTDPFEDFAETFIFYIRYGEIFRYLIANPENKVLQKKYDFMKEEVFSGKEFNLAKPLSDKAFLIFSKAKQDIFDVTKLEGLV